MLFKLNLCAYLICQAALLSSQNVGLGWAKQLSPNPSNTVVSFLKTDAAGNLYELHEFDGTVDVDPGPAVNTLTSVTGPGGGASFYLLKLDAAGNFSWVRQINSVYNNGARNLGMDVQGNLLIIGTFNDVTDFDPGPTTYTLDPANGNQFACKLNSSGNFTWARQMGAISTQTNSYSYFSSVTTDATGNVYLSGSYNGTLDFDPSASTYTLSTVSPTVHNGFVCKLDVNGNFAWAGQFYGLIATGGAYVIGTDALGNCYVTGEATGGTDFDPGPGTYTLSVPSSTFSAYTACLDGSGNFSWAVDFASIPAITNAIGDMYGNSYLISTFTGTIDADPGPLVYNLLSAGSVNGFIIKLNNTGQLSWAAAFGGSGAVLPYLSTQDINLDIYIGGYFQNRVDLAPGPAVATFTASGNRDAFIMKMDQAGNFKWAKQFGSTGN